MDEIEGNNYEPNPSPLCYWCEYSNTNPCITKEGKNLCPYYSLWTKDNRANFSVKLKWTGLKNYEKQRDKLINLMQLENDDDFDLEI